MGFIVDLKIPDKTPTDSPSTFLFEWGHDGSTLASRPMAQVLPAPFVKALTNAKVDYATNVAGREHLLTFQINIRSELPTGGGTRSFSICQ